MQSASRVPQGPRHWIKIKPLSLFLLHWGHWEGKDVVNQAINLVPEAATFGFLPCSSSVMQGRGWHPGPLCPRMEGPSQSSLLCLSWESCRGTLQGFMGSSTGCCPSLKSIPFSWVCCCYQGLQSPSHRASHGSPLPHQRLSRPPNCTLVFLNILLFQRQQVFHLLPIHLAFQFLSQRRWQRQQCCLFCSWSWKDFSCHGQTTLWWRAQIVN